MLKVGQALCLDICLVILDQRFIEGCGKINFGSEISELLSI